MFLLGNTVERKAPSLQIDVFKQDCSESVSEFLELFMQSMLKRNFIPSFQKWLPDAGALGAPTRGSIHRLTVSHERRLMPSANEIPNLLLLFNPISSR